MPDDSCCSNRKIYTLETRNFWQLNEFARGDRLRTFFPGPLLRLAAAIAQPGQKNKPENVRNFHPPKNAHPPTSLATHFTTSCPQKHHVQPPASPKTPAKSTQTVPNLSPYQVQKKKQRKHPPNQKKSGMDLLKQEEIPHAQQQTPRRNQRPSPLPQPQQPKDPHRQQRAQRKNSILRSPLPKRSMQTRIDIQHRHKNHEHADARDPRQHLALLPSHVSLVAHKVCR